MKRILLTLLFAIAFYGICMANQVTVLNYTGCAYYVDPGDGPVYIGPYQTIVLTSPPTPGDYTGAKIRWVGSSLSIGVNYYAIPLNSSQSIGVLPPCIPNNLPYLCVWQQASPTLNAALAIYC